MAIATDCGEGAGRLPPHLQLLAQVPVVACRPSLHQRPENGHGNVHLGTAFHLAQTAGVDIREEKRAKDTKNALDAENAVPPFLTHTHTYLIMRTETDNRTQPTLRIAGKRNFQEANRCSLFHCCPKPNGRSPCNTSAATAPQEHSATCSCSERSPS